MKKIGLLCIFLLFLVGCEPADDEYAEIEERAEADVDNLSEQISALREQIEQLEQKMDEKEEVTVTTVTVVEEEPQMINRKMPKFIYNLIFSQFFDVDLYRNT